MKYGRLACNKPFSTTWFEISKIGLEVFVFLVYEASCKQDKQAGQANKASKQDRSLGCPP
jgi:hypothetical protein